MPFLILSSSRSIICSFWWFILCFYALNWCQQERGWTGWISRGLAFVNVRRRERSLYCVFFLTLPYSLVSWFFTGTHFHLSFPSIEFHSFMHHCNINYLWCDSPPPWSWSQFELSSEQGIALRKINKWKIRHGFTISSSTEKKGFSVFSPLSRKYVKGGTYHKGLDYFIFGLACFPYIWHLLSSYYVLDTALSAWHLLTFLIIINILIKRLLILFPF